MIQMGRSFELKTGMNRPYCYETIIAIILYDDRFVKLIGQVTAENLDSLSKEKRDKKLIKMAKEVVLRHARVFIESINLQ